MQPPGADAPFLGGSRGLTAPAVQEPGRSSFRAAGYDSAYADDHLPVPGALVTGPLTGLLVTGDDTIRVEPPRATLGELQLTNRLQMVRIDRDVLGVAERLKRIDTGLVLMFDKNVEWEDGRGKGIYVLYWEGLNDRGQLVEDFVGAYRELDQRIVNLIERIDAQGRGRHDLATELEKLEREKEREHDRETTERMGPMGELLRHAIRKDLGATGSQSLPVSSGVYRNRAEKRAADRRRRRGTR